jgi:hypothetical protein
MSENSVISVRFELGSFKVEVSRVAAARNLLGEAGLFLQLNFSSSTSLERNESQELQSALLMQQLLLQVC